MGALTHKEREALEDVFLSIHAKSKTEKLLPHIKKMSKIAQKYTKKGYIFFIKSLKKIIYVKIS